VRATKTPLNWRRQMKNDEGKGFYCARRDGRKGNFEPISFFLSRGFMHRRGQNGWMAGRHRLFWLNENGLV
jgi:hypothetical protein